MSSSFSLPTLLEIWQAQLKDWAAEGSISKAARSALALEGSQPLLQELESALAAGDFSGLPPVALLPATSMPGAAGAYAASMGTIYLNEDWLLTATEEAIISVLTEELGAFLDDQLNTVDTQGDEGALFSAELLGLELTKEERSAIAAEDDRITISVNGQELQAEANSIFPAEFELSSLDGNNGFTINGIDPGDFSGWSVSGAGDVNGDGIDDLIIGADRADRSGVRDAGESYVVYGRSNGFSASLELASLNGSNGFRINGINGIDEFDLFGYSVSGAGDVNGDGIDDLIIGAYNTDPNGKDGAGESYVVFGSTTPFSESLELASLNGRNGFRINGIDTNDNSGYSVSGAGDVNGDGIDDLIIGARSASRADRSVQPNGESYVVFGSSNGFSASLELASLDGSNGFIINGIDPGDFSGESVSGAGDVNGDGIDDLIIGASQADPNGKESAGESYVVFGNSTPFSASLELASLNGRNGFIINGIDESDFSGVSVSGAGDVNGDGIDDLIIGAERADLIIGSRPQRRAGESYVVYGRSNGFSASLELASLNGSNGFRINGIDSGDVSESGRSVSGAGDVNGDGIDDLIIGAPRSGAGESYVVYGRSATPVRSSTSYTLKSGEGNLILTGNNAINGTGNNLDNKITGNNANNTINGKQGGDTMIGKKGNDTYYVDNKNDKVIEVANQGKDTVRSSITETLSNNVENLELKGNKAINGIGNNLNNKITGNNAKNVINGRGGGDEMIGKKGNDTYYVDNKNDKVIEVAGQGIDTVRSSVTETLSPNVENLILTGRKAINGNGNNLNNRITGNNKNNSINGKSGKDVIIGKLGRDILTGGGNADKFIYNSINDSGTTNATRDIITDFSGIDKINLSSIDANELKNGNQKFEFIGSKPFTEIGQVRFEKGNGFLSMNTDNDSKADMQIDLFGIASFKETFLIL